MRKKKLQELSNAVIPVLNESYVRHEFEEFPDKN